MTLPEFLLARIAEDEATALAVNEGAWTRVIATEHEGLDYAEVQDAGHCYVMETSSLAIAEHAMTWKPARVLAECEAKRRIVGETDGYDFAVLDSILMHLAQPYSDHPDFDPAWRIS